MVSITVNGHNIAPESQQPGGDNFVKDAARSNYILVHCSHSLQPAEHEKLRQLGVEVLTYHDDNTYSCRFEPADLRDVRDLPFVEFANVFADKLCVSPSHREALARKVQSAVKTTTSEAHPQAASDLTHPDEELRWFHVFLHDQRRSHEAVAAISTIPSAEKDTIVDERHGILRVRFMMSDLDAVARVDDVARIQEVGERGISNWRARPIIGLETMDASAFQFSRDKFDDQKGQLTALDKARSVQAALRGAGQTVAVADTGFDKGYPFGTIRGPPADVHAAFKDRVKNLWNYTTDDTDEYADKHGHGTHVAGSVLACGQTTTGLKIEGAAPGAHLISQRIADINGSTAILGPTENIWEDVMNPAKPRNNQTRVHNNSWGSTWDDNHGQWEYNGDAEIVDDLVYKNQDWIIVFAAGNDGERITGATLGGAPAAKNAITVGACQNTHPLESAGGFPNSLYKYNITKPNGSPKVVASFSNRGPIKNTQRRKPDVLAPGCVVYSAKSRMDKLTESKVTKPDGSIEYDINIHGVTDDPAYWYMHGTSMAAPFVSGCCAGLRNAYSSAKGFWPSSAMVKALLVNGAVDISDGTSNGGQAPNVVQGFGRVNMTNSIRPLFTEGGGCYDSWKQGKGLGLNNSLLFLVNVGDAGKTLIATMAFVDKKGLALQNFFSLTVETLPRTVPRQAENGEDNNVQRLMWPKIVVGYYNIKVTCTKGLQDATTGKVGHFAVCWDLR